MARKFGSPRMHMIRTRRQIEALLGHPLLSEDFEKLIALVAGARQLEHNEITFVEEQITLNCWFPIANRSTPWDLALAKRTNRLKQEGKLPKNPNE